MWHILTYGAIGNFNLIFFLVSNAVILEQIDEYRLRPCISVENNKWRNIFSTPLTKRIPPHYRAVARSENPGGLVVLGGDNVSPLVEIGLTDLRKTGGAKAPPPAPTLRRPCSYSNHSIKRTGRLST